MDSTLRSNLSVGMPLDTISYPANLLDNPGIRRLDENDEHFLKLRTAWSDGLKNLFNELPEFF